MRRLVMLAALGALVSACATAQIKKIDPKSNEDGLRFYQPAPYLLVSVTSIDSKTVKYTTQIVWLPDYSKPYIVKPTGRIGKANLTVNLANGWNLTSLTLDRDASPQDLIRETAGAIVSLAALAEDGVGLLEPGLYRLDFSSDGSRLDSLSRVQME